MSTQGRQVRLVLTALLACVPLLVAAQNFAVNWWTIDGGGGASTGGVYTVSGTIGQPDAGKLSRNRFTVDGGFWGVIAAVQSPGAPFLSIGRTATNSVVISWPNPSSGYVLQENANLGTTNWSEVLATPAVVRDEKLVVVPLPAGNRFYRLVR